MDFVFMVLIFLFIALCIVLAFLSGYAVAVIKGIPFVRKKPPDISEEEKKKKEQAVRDWNNFMSFDGTSQE